jgi:hypothetical protein
MSLADQTAAEIAGGQATQAATGGAGQLPQTAAELQAGKTDDQKAPPDAVWSVPVQGF